MALDLELPPREPMRDPPNVRLSTVAMIVLDTNVVSELIRANLRSLASCQLVCSMTKLGPSSSFVTADQRSRVTVPELSCFAALAHGASRQISGRETEGMLLARTIRRPHPSIRQPGCPCFRRYLRQQASRRAPNQPCRLPDRRNRPLPGSPGRDQGRTRIPGLWN